jgi:hypothetical protein
MQHRAAAPILDGSPMEWRNGDTKPGLGGRKRKSEPVSASASEVASTQWLRQSGCPAQTRALK